MDPITLILSALAAGAATGLGDTVSQAVKDAYGALKSMLGRRLRDRPDGPMILARHEEAPDTWQGPLRSELEGAQVGADEEVIAMARHLVELIQTEAPRALGKFHVDASTAKGVQIGDHGTQGNVFNDG